MSIPLNSADAIAVINAVEKSLKDMALFDIHRSLRRVPPDFVTRKSNFVAGQDAIASAFILGCCLIEAAGHFLIPLPTVTTRPSGAVRRPDGQSQLAFEAFCSECMDGYDGTVLYQATRCGLAHAYSPASIDPNVLETYWLTHNEAAAHLQSDIGDPRIRYINAQNFIADLHDGLTAFFDAVRTQRVLRSGRNPQRTFLDWAEFSGFMAAPASTAAGAAATAAAAVATATTATTRPLWGGNTPTPIGMPLAGIGSRLVADGGAPSTALNAISVPASGWCGLSNLGILGVSSLYANYTPTGTVATPLGFRAIPRLPATGRPRKKSRGQRRRASP